MKKMTRTVKCLVALFVMAAAFCVTGITAEAAPVTVQQVGSSSNSVSIKWNGVNGAKYYGYKIATDPAFTNVIEEDYTSITEEYISGLVAGASYYVSVGYGPSDKDCSREMSAALEVVTEPVDIPAVKFIGANDTSVTVSYEGSVGATGYDITYNNATFPVNTTSYTIPIIDGATSYIEVKPYRQSASGYKAVGYGKTLYDFSKLTTKLANSNFGLTSALTNINVFYFAAIGYGNGVDLEAVPVSGKAATVTSTGSLNSTSSIRVDNMKKGVMYKYRMRAYVTTTDGQKIYGNWSDYRYMINSKDSKYTTSGKKIKLKWGSLKGVSKIKVQISTSENGKYKTCKVLSGKKTGYTITKYGKKSLKRGKKYYIRVIYQAKGGTSDVYGKADVTVR